MSFKDDLIKFLYKKDSNRTFKYVTLYPPTRGNLFIFSNIELTKGDGLLLAKNDAQILTLDYMSEKEIMDQCFTRSNIIESFFSCKSLFEKKRCLARYMPHLNKNENRYIGLTYYYKTTIELCHALTSTLPNINKLDTANLSDVEIFEAKNALLMNKYSTFEENIKSYNNLCKSILEQPA